SSFPSEADLTASVVAADVPIGSLLFN
ncbi:MAG: hypothetical protein QOJ36_1241, partial [Verrucomicrobiota bacterium]